MALGAVEELGGVGGMVESTLMVGMEETYCKGSRQHFHKGAGRSEIEKHTTVMICWVVWRTGGRPLLAVKESCRGCCAVGPGE